MMTRIEKYKELRDRIEKENNEKMELILKQISNEMDSYIAFLNAIDKMLDEIDKNIDELNKATETLLKKAKEGAKA